MVKQISLGSAVRVGGFLDRKAGCFLLMKNGGAVIPSFLSSIVYSLYLMKNDYFVYGVLVLLCRQMVVGFSQAYHLLSHTHKNDPLTFTRFILASPVPSRSVARLINWQKRRVHGDSVRSPRLNVSSGTIIQFFLYPCMQ